MSKNADDVIFDIRMARDRDDVPADVRKTLERFIDHWDNGDYEYEPDWDYGDGEDAPQGEAESPVA